MIGTTVGLGAHVCVRGAPITTDLFPVMARLADSGAAYLTLDEDHAQIGANESAALIRDGDKDEFWISISPSDKAYFRGDHSESFEKTHAAGSVPETRYAKNCAAF